MTIAIAAICCFAASLLVAWAVCRQVNRRLPDYSKFSDATDAYLDALSTGDARAIAAAFDGIPQVARRK